MSAAITARSADKIMKTLARIERHHFGDWNQVRLQIVCDSGLYAIWDGDSFVYVGVAGTGKKGRGLRGRLSLHALGIRGSDRFCIYVFDHFILPGLTPSQIKAAAAGKLSLDDLTQVFICERLSFACIPMDVYVAMELERQIQAGNWELGPPRLNSLPATDDALSAPQRRRRHLLDSVV